jgi:hypothetical protein
LNVSIFEIYYVIILERLGKYRSVLKDIKASEEHVQSLQKMEREARSKFDNAVKKNKATETLRAELAEAQRHVLEGESSHEGLKREKLKLAMKLKYDGMLELAAKV